MIHAIGCGIGSDQDLSKRRYDKIIIMTDADVDGSHIRTLLLCFFYRQMYQLVSAGHVYVAQPPLFRVRSRRQVYYVQSEEEMKSQLLEKGLGDAVFEPEDGDAVEGADMRKLCTVLAGMEEALVALERRGLNLKEHAERLEADSGKLPVYHVAFGQQEAWFTSRANLDTFMQEQVDETEPGPETENEPAEGNGEDTGEGNGQAASPYRVTELHEVRTINSGLAELAEMKFDIQALLPQERTGVEAPRYVLRRGETEQSLEDLRGLLAAVRAAGEKGLQITRFKGLGEMNAEELRETTLDPENRTLVQVSMRDVGAAEEVFRILMGDQVEPRRDFIEKHALEVRNLDV